MSCCISKRRLPFDLVLFEVLDVGLDRLLLGEDAVAEDRVALVVPPSTFLWTPVAEARLVDGDDRWIFVFEVLVGVVGVDCVTSFVGSGVELTEF